MNAGRELDALVANRVFGVELLTQEQMHAEAHRVWATQPACTEFMGGFSARLSGDPVGMVYDQKIPRYSTEIAAAWKVVEAMQRRGFYVTIRADELNDDGGFFDVHCEVDGDHWTDSKQHWTADAPLAASAICLAALHAVNAEVPA